MMRLDSFVFKFFKDIQTPNFTVADVNEGTLTY